MKQGSWSARLTHGIGRRVAAARQEQRLSAQAVADRCADLGMPSLTRQVIAFIENGRRESVSVAELLVLAAALDIPPAELLWPLQNDTHKIFEFLPGQDSTPWAAARWFAGTGDMWPGQSTAWQWLSGHDQLVARALDGSWDERDVARAHLILLRCGMREAGYQPPPLPQGLVHLDNRMDGADQ
jgi:transcriptional regulator with XRE-family HTH domain